MGGSAAPPLLLLPLPVPLLPPVVPLLPSIPTAAAAGGAARCVRRR